MCQKYVKSCKKLKEKSLPPKEKLLSILNNKAISDQNYKHAERVCNWFTMKKIEDYIFLHNMYDILTSLAIDVDFMKNISPKFNLNPFKPCDSFAFMGM